MTFECFVIGSPLKLINNNNSKRRVTRCAKGQVPINTLLIRIQSKTEIALNGNHLSSRWFDLLNCTSFHRDYLGSESLNDSKLHTVLSFLGVFLGPEVFSHIKPHPNVCNILHIRNMPCNMNLIITSLFFQNNFHSSQY